MADLKDKKTYDEFKAAIEKNDIAGTKKLIAANPKFDLNTQDEKGKTLLHHAASQHHNTPWYYLTSGPTYFNPAVTKLLMDAGARVDIKDNEGDTPLHDAFYLEAHKALLEHPNLLKGTPDAGKSQNDRVLVALKMESRFNKTVYSHMAQYVPESFKYIFDTYHPPHQDIDSKHNNVFHVARGEALEHVLAKLSKKDIATLINKPNDQGQTPLCYLCGDYGRPDDARLLLKHGADPLIPDAKKQLPLHVTGYADVAQILMGDKTKRTAMLTSFSEAGRLPIHEAAQEYDAKTLNTLLSNGAKLTDKTKSGDTVLAFVRYEEVYDAIRANFKKPGEFKTFLNTPNDSKENALHTLMSHSYSVAVAHSTALTERMIRDGVDINAVSKRGTTPLDELRVATESAKLFFPNISTDSAKLEKLLISKGAKTSEEMESANLAAEIKKYATGREIVHAAWPKTVAPEAAHMSDYTHIPELPAVQLQGPPQVTLVVIESAKQGEEKENSDHIRRTTSIANGTLQKLMGKDAQGIEVIGVEDEIHASGSGKNFHNVNAVYYHPHVAQGRVIFSNSIGIDGEKVDGYGYKVEDKLEVRLNDRKAVVYHSAGNSADYRDEKNGTRQAWQNHEEIMRGPRAMSVGAGRFVSLDEKLYFVTEHYSNPSPAFLGSVDTYQGKEISGTSFSAPAAAAIHAALTRRYGQWEQNPHGLTPDEIQHLMCATCDKTRYVDIWPSERTDPEALQAYSKRQGFGMLDPLKADKAAAEMLTFKQTHKIATKTQEEHLALTPENKETDSKSYRNSFTLTKSLLITNASLELGFDIGKDDQGRPILAKEKIDKEQLAKMQSGTMTVNGVSYPLSFSALGSSSTPALNGQTLPAGTVISIETKAPLHDGDIRIFGFDPKQNAITPMKKAEEVKTSSLSLPVKQTDEVAALAFRAPEGPKQQAI